MVVLATATGGAVVFSVDEGAVDAATAGGAAVVVVAVGEIVVPAAAGGGGSELSTSRVLLIM